MFKVLEDLLSTKGLTPRLLFYVVGFLFWRSDGLIADALFDEVAGMIRALLEIQVPAILRCLFDGLEVRWNGILAEPADFSWLLG